MSTSTNQRLASAAVFGLLLVFSLALFAQVQAAGTTASSTGTSMWSLAGNVFPRYSFYFARAAETAAVPATPKKFTADHWFHVMEMPNGEVMIPWDDERV